LVPRTEGGGIRPESARVMKRHGNLYDQVISIENLSLAADKAMKGKRKQYGVVVFQKNRDSNLIKLHNMLANQTYCTSPYIFFKVMETKERDVCKLPFFPDRIVHHAIMNILEPIWVGTMTAFTYSCIKGRGIYGMFLAIKKALSNKEETAYCLKIDVRKFYQSIDHCVLKQILRRKIKDERLLWLLEEIIDSSEGVPIGNYLSQYFANLYLSPFDHWVKEVKKAPYCFRYSDDIVLFHRSKDFLHGLLAEIKTFLGYYKLEVKDNYQVFPVDAQGADIIGFKFFHDKILLRSRIKRNFARSVAKGAKWETVQSYLSWAKHADCKHLIKTLNLMKSFSELKSKITKKFAGEKKSIKEVLSTPEKPKILEVLAYRIKRSKYNAGPRLDLDINLDGKNYLVWTGSENLIDSLKQLSIDDFPFSTTIVEEFKRFEFR
jgi:RNA-directed DNA polymerase